MRIESIVNEIDDVRIIIIRNKMDQLKIGQEQVYHDTICVFFRYIIYLFFLYILIWIKYKLHRWRRRFRESARARERERDRREMSVLCIMVVINERDASTGSNHSGQGGSRRGLCVYIYFIIYILYVGCVYSSGKKTYFPLVFFISNVLLYY